MIPYGRQSITDVDVEAVVEALRSDYLTQGPLVPRFEEALSSKVGAQYGVATTNATSALHIACLALGLGPGDLLWTSPITFVASANCALYCGAEVDFVDIDPETGNMCSLSLEQKLERAKKLGRLPSVVMPVHLAGRSCAMRRIRDLSLKYGFKVIEDASHAIGAQYEGRQVGCCENSDITVFSFHPVKIITTAEGGMATTNNEKLAEKMRLLRSHGVTRDDQKMARKPHGPWYYEQISLGFNYRLTDMQAALGLAQLDRLEEFVRRRRWIAKTYREGLKDLPLRLPKVGEKDESSWHLFIVRLNANESTKSHKEVFLQLRELGVGVNLHYIPVPSQPFYESLGFKISEYPEAKSFYSEAISLPIFPGLDDASLNAVVGAVKSCLI